jgi:hydrogenase/urease accessory protein HupE
MFSVMAAMVVLSASLAQAHNLPVGSSRWCFGKHNMVANLDLGSALLSELPGIKDGKYPIGSGSDAELKQIAVKVLQPYLDRKLSLVVNDRHYPIKVDRLVPKNSNLYTAWLSSDNIAFQPGENAVRIDYRLFFEETGNAHLNLAYYYLSDATGEALQQLFDFSQPSGQYSFDSSTTTWNLSVQGSTSEVHPAPVQAIANIPHQVAAGDQEKCPVLPHQAPALPGGKVVAAPPAPVAAAPLLPEKGEAPALAGSPARKEPIRIGGSSPPGSAAIKTTTWSTFTQFLRLGIEHILTGYDHIAFLVALIVIGLSTREVLKIITAFTVAHSITLLLAALQIVNLDSRFVESAIALSICYVALENLLRKKIRYRWLVTFCFGLLHGFGFASALQELIVGKSNLMESVLSFNLGVETGQLLIFVLLLPVLQFLKHNMEFRRVTTGASLAVFLLGFTWLVERVFDLKLLPI